MQDGAGQFAVEAMDVAGEFGKAEIDQAVELAQPIAEVLQQPLAQANQFAQLLGGGVGQRRGRGCFWAAKRAIPKASMASVLVRSRSSPANRWVRSGLSNATAKPAVANTANRFFQ